MAATGDGSFSSVLSQVLVRPASKSIPTSRPLLALAIAHCPLQLKMQKENVAYTSSLDFPMPTMACQQGPDGARKGNLVSKGASAASLFLLFLGVLPEAEDGTRAWLTPA